MSEGDKLFTVRGRQAAEVCMTNFKKAGLTMVLPVQLNSRGNRPVSCTGMDTGRGQSNFSGSALNIYPELKLSYLPAVKPQGSSIFVLPFSWLGSRAKGLHTLCSPLLHWRASSTLQALTALVSCWCCDQIPGKKQLRGKGPNGSQFEETIHHGAGV